MTVIEATFRVTTPMFCGGADGQQAELRAASFKGVLRFWWRACAWSHFDGDLHRIRREEEYLFGGPDTGQSRIWIRLAGRPAVPKPVNGGTVLNRGLGSRYLGFGLEGLGGSPNRDCLSASFDVIARIDARRVDSSKLDQVVEAVRALGMLGGLGARSRRGYGSLSLHGLSVGGKEQSLPRTPAELGEAVRVLGDRRSGKLPEFTALSVRSRHVVLTSGAAEAMVLLDQLGTAYAEFRGGKRGGARSGSFRNDRKTVRSGMPPGAYPQRIAFGLPLNFGKGLSVVEPVDHRRRGSPLFFHIHECGGQAAAVVSFMPAKFLPGSGPAVEFGHGSRRVAEESLYRPVTDFLDHLEQDGDFMSIGEEGQ